MLRKLLRAKIHRATVTRCDPDYVGSITLDGDLLRIAGIMPNEAVSVLDIDNAARFETYVIQGRAGGGGVEVNGAAAKLVEPGHKLIVLAYGFLEAAEVEAHEAVVVLADPENRVDQVLHYPSTLEQPVEAG